jgi:predicted Zn-dependent protease with MMP-like domain
MREILDIIGPPLRIAGICAFVAGVALLLLDPPSFDALPDLLVILCGAIVFLALMAWLTVALIGDEMPEPEFRRLERRSEALAKLPPPELPPSEFDLLVAQALDDLPPEFRELLQRTPVVVSNRGREHHAYGHYMGGTIARDLFHDRIVIYQDTLERDFGHDPALLRAQVERTVRHEIAHHLGWDERGVHDLGL